MKRFITAIIINTIFLSSCIGQDQREDNYVKGLYVNYVGAEYENTLIVCNSNDVWRLEGENELDKLNTIYKESTLSQYGELYIEVRGNYVPIDKAKFPNEHYLGTFNIFDLLNYSSDNNLIEECREN